MQRLNQAWSEKDDLALLGNHLRLLVKERENAVAGLNFLVLSGAEQLKAVEELTVERNLQFRLLCEKEDEIGGCNRRHREFFGSLWRWWRGGLTAKGVAGRGGVSEGGAWRSQGPR